MQPDTKITIYRGADTLRVVAGDHTPHAGSRNCRISVYPNAELAYANEACPNVRAAIQRVAPNVDTTARVALLPAGTMPVHRSPRVLERSDIREAAIQSIADERAPNDPAPITEEQIQRRMSAMRRAGKGNDWTPYEVRA